MGSTEIVRLEHGGGGRLMRELIEGVVIPSYTLRKVEGGIGLPEMDDGGSIPMEGFHLVVSTDAYTVKPLFFPGGDLGKLAACGTINDLAMLGARPVALTSSVVVEEGFPIEKLARLLRSMNSVLEEVGVPLVAGDTKVMERGKIDEAVITATGIGIAERVITDGGLSPGDKLIVTGTVGDHEVALLSFREGLEFEVEIRSDVAPLWETVKAALEVGGIKAMKDPTRGGLAGALNEMARKSKVDLFVYEERIPIRDEVRGAAEMLGLDPLEMTNEGVAIIGVDQDLADEVLKRVRETKYGQHAEIVGEAKEGEGTVILETVVGGRRILDEPIGLPIPRVC